MSIRENTNRLIEGFRKIRPGLFAGRDPIRVLEALAQQPQGQLSELGQFAMQLREIAISDTAVGSIESLMNFDNGIGAAMQKAGLPGLAGPKRKLDRVAFLAMSMRELEEFAGRFAIMIGDALSPEAQANAIERAFTGSGFFQGHAVAVHAINPSMSHNYVLDPASSVAVTRAVENAHQQIERVIRDGEVQRIIATARPGSVEEDDSRKFYGLQVADVAAGYARDIFERIDKPTGEAARDLKQHFDGVFLNDGWL